MKIRQGFVSNSSSSSFLVAYKDMKDFDRFSSFEGFDIFKKDMEAAEEYDAVEVFDAVKEFMIFKLDNYFYDLFYDWSNSSESREEFDVLWDIFHLASSDFFSANSLLRKIDDTFCNLREAFWADLEKNEPELYKLVKPLSFSEIDLDDYVRRVGSSEEKEKWHAAMREYHKKFGEYYNGEVFEQGLERIVEVLLEDYKKSSIKLKVLNYDDHSEEGAYMEHSFMPFLTGDPEGKVSVFTNSEH